MNRRPPLDTRGVASTELCEELLLTHLPLLLDRGVLTCGDLRRVLGLDPADGGTTATAAEKAGR